MLQPAARLRHQNICRAAEKVQNTERLFEYTVGCDTSAVLQLKKKSFPQLNFELSFHQHPVPDDIVVTWALHPMHGWLK